MGIDAKTLYDATDGIVPYAMRKMLLEEDGILSDRDRVSFALFGYTPETKRADMAKVAAKYGLDVDTDKEVPFFKSSPEKKGGASGWTIRIADERERRDAGNAGIEKTDVPPAETKRAQSVSHDIDI